MLLIPIHFQSDAQTSRCAFKSPGLTAGPAPNTRQAMIRGSAWANPISGGLARLVGWLRVSRFRSAQEEGFSP